MIRIKVMPGETRQVRLPATVIYAGGDVEVQAKTVTPDFCDRVILPDGGYDYLTSVTVRAVPVAETPNAAGGETLTVGGQNGN